MILLFGGTSDSVDIARLLVDAGRNVLVSTATDEPMAIDEDSRIERRCGRLDTDPIVALIRERGVSLVLDATHPYALNVQANARAAARQAGIHYLRYSRPASDVSHDAMRLVDSHEEAATVAFSLGKPVLLTTGANNLTMYVEQSRKTSIPLFARVLPREESLQSCRDAGLPDDRVIAAKGPFSVEANIAHIERTGADVLVAKDSGAVGGLPERLQAAETTGCQVVLIRRPDGAGKQVHDFESLMAEVARL